MVSYDGSNSDSFKEITINSKFEMKKKSWKKKRKMTLKSYLDSFSFRPRSSSSWMIKTSFLDI